MDIDIYRENYGYDELLWPIITLEILYNPGTITKVYSQILDNANKRWDFYADTKSLAVPFAIEQVNRAILDAKNRGVRFRFVTEITNDNVTFCKNSVLKVAEIRHLGGIKGNFGVSDTEYISTSDSFSTRYRVASDIEQNIEAAKTTTASNFSTCSLQQCERGYPTAATYFRNPME